VFGGGVYHELIRNYVPEYVDGGNWSTVTFDDTLNMATGNYRSSAYMVDENGTQEGIFLSDEGYSKKIADAFSLFPAKAPPGSAWVYQSHATFIVTQAMNAYLQQQRGSSADLFDFLREDVFNPAKFSTGLSTLRTDNAEKPSVNAGKPIGSYGLFYISDDVAKLGKLLNNDGGKTGGTQVLDPVRLRDTLFQNPDHLGLPISSVQGMFADSNRYQRGFWGRRFTHVEFPPQKSCDFWVARMGGYGGISIVLIPNGITYYVFSDNDEFPWYGAVQEAEKIAPACEN
jgi:CubicO group peptidase (beta-lactamase class C family)